MCIFNQIERRSISQEEDTKHRVKAIQALKPKSHPSIQYEQVPIVRGRLFDLNQNRKKIISRVVRSTHKDFGNKNLDSLITEALYLERKRIKRIKKGNLSYLFNINRHSKDRLLWRSIQKSLLKKTTEVDRKKMMSQILKTYSNEIAGHFDPKVYQFATRFVPWCFSWILNAASLKRFLPWGMTESLEQKLIIDGEIEHIRNLSKKGTILLLPTHQSNIDSILIGYVIYLMKLPPFAYGGGLNLFTNPLFSFFMSSLGAYKIDRDKKNKIYKNTLKNYSAELLKDGIHSIFYPGGGRSRSGALESRLKLGLLGTAIKAQIENMKISKPNPSIYIVPMTTSYHFVLEASSLIDRYLEDIGQHLFMGTEHDDAPPIIKMGNFFWKLFSGQGNITIRIGKPMDVFGNLVDENGISLGPNGTSIDPKHWLMTRGTLQHVPQRDREYTRRLGRRLVDRFYAENTVLSSHLVAFAYFMALRKKFRHLDVFHLLRLTKEQRTLPFQAFQEAVEECFNKIRFMKDRGGLCFSSEFNQMNMDQWIAYGMEQVGRLHDAKVIKKEGDSITSDDLSTLYYYRNRLSGYGISLLGETGRAKTLRGELDEKGFLA